jgi:Zn-dependent metalloprotease
VLKGKPTAELVIYPVSSREVLPERAHVPEHQRNALDYRTAVSHHLLAYHVHIELESQDRPSRTDFFVDALSGQILKKWDSLMEAKQSSIGTGYSQYYGNVMLNTTLYPGSAIIIAGNPSSLAARASWLGLFDRYELSDMTGGMPFSVMDANHSKSFTDKGTVYSMGGGGRVQNIWGDGSNYVEGGPTNNANGQTAAVDVHYGLQLTSAFYKNVFGRKGIDDKNTPTYAKVHHDTNLINAYWDPNTFSMAFGDGGTDKDSGNYYQTVTSLDIVAHEMSHGVCEKTAGLVYSGESGGLNEANSDIMGNFAAFYGFNGGTGYEVPEAAPVAGTNRFWIPWTIGSQLTAKPFRYMFCPSMNGKARNAWSADLGTLNVHESSGPMNRCMYFLSQGSNQMPSTHSDYLPYGMTGIGNDKAARIWYYAMANYMTSTSDYAAARTACIRAAESLYNSGATPGYNRIPSLNPDVEAVENAFHAINVGNASPDFITNGNFEGGTAGWDGNTYCIGDWSSQKPIYSGNKALWLNGYGSVRTESVQQVTATIPNDGNYAELSFYLSIDTEETYNYPYDTLVMTVEGIGGPAAGKILSYAWSNSNATSGFTKQYFNLSSFVGSQVKITFAGSEDYSFQTSFVIDKVRLYHAPGNVSFFPN